MARQAVRAVGLDDIIGNILHDDGPLLALTLRAHLSLEALLVELINTVEPGDHVWKWNFPTKTDKAVQHGLVRSELKVALDRLNDFRNDFGHIFGHSVGLIQVHALAQDIGPLAFDAFEGVDLSSIEETAESYGGDLGILTELLWTLGFELASELMERGGRDVFAARANGS